MIIVLIHGVFFVMGKVNYRFNKLHTLPVYPLILDLEVEYAAKKYCFTSQQIDLISTYVVGEMSSRTWKCKIIKEKNCDPVF